MTRQKKISIGRFEVLRRLGQGLQGRVYLATDPVLERRVALKVINLADCDIVKSEECVREARIAAQISHPNVVPIFEVELYNEAPLLVYEYVEGINLQQYLARHAPLDTAGAMPLMHGIAAGLSSAHQRDIIHLDLSPGNILIDFEGCAHITDFGLARLMTLNSRIKTNKPLYGTPRYISPEHVRGEALTAASDVFSMGLLFYEMLTGVPAIAQEELEEVYQAVRHAHINWGKLQHRGLAPELIAIIRDMCQLRVEWRYRDAGEVLTALEQQQELKRGENRSALALQFLLRRLEKRPEFPACSSSISEINRLTEENSNTNFNKLAVVIARDYTLTNRVLKIANSVIFDRGSGGVKTISMAISRLGLNLVRMICNGLLLFKQADNANSELRDTLVASFVAGLIARHIVKTRRPRIAEEAFICALFHRLGTHLLVFYLPDEYEEIARGIAAGSKRRDAERAVLSTTCAALGAAIARKWHFPETIIGCMEQLPAGELETPDSDEAILRHAANFSNELCDLFATAPENEALLETSAEFSNRHAGIFRSNAEILGQIAQATADKFAQLAPGLGVNYNDSSFCKGLSRFADMVAAAERERNPVQEAAAS